MLRLQVRVSPGSYNEHPSHQCRHSCLQSGEVSGGIYGESILTQDYADLEIICVNDGSTDASLSMLREYEKRDARVRIIDVPNGGYGRAMNLGMEAATGEYFAILEPDDYLPQGAYRKLLTLAEDNRLDIAKGCYDRFCDVDGKRIFTPNLNVEAGVLICPKEYLRAFLFELLTQTCLFRLDFLRRHGIRYQETPGASYQDTAMFMLSLSYAERLMCTEESVYCYRTDNPASSSQQYASKPFALRDEYSYIRRKLESNPEVWEKVKPAWFYRRFRVHEFIFPKLHPDTCAEYLHDLRRELTEFRDVDKSLWKQARIEGFEKLMFSSERYVRHSLHRARLKYLLYYLPSAITFGKTGKRYREKKIASLKQWRELSLRLDRLK